MSRSAHPTASSGDTVPEVEHAQQAEYVAFLHRAPFAVDAANMGFLTGYREDCSYQQGQYVDLELSVGMLDNDFRNPDLERYIERFRECEPTVGVIGDAYSPEEANEYVQAVRTLQEEYPDTEIIIAPKCREALDVIPDDVTLGYSCGAADLLAHEFSDPADWRGRRVHLLGGSPHKQLDAIEQLTQPTLTGDPPAQIVGVDWNGLHRGEQFGEFWTAGGWDDSGRNADHVTVRKLVRHSLGRIKAFWQAQGVWPETKPYGDSEPLEYGGPTPNDLKRSACTACSANVWTAERGPIVAEYGTGDVRGYCSHECYFEHRTRNRLEEAVDERSVFLPQ
ncbi:DUF6610 family protein [Saliphagus infecundisoli]|uniref:DUF6610 family protein n=1 Tax=Saliphagus infecundisoli TaxID=1849069 RepID=A0ABD5QC18_9EURY|nr:DUF6610 family protein [Saliphagus infecundisoli]